MFIKIDDVKVYYEVEGQGHPILLLHGWGQSVAAFKPVFDYLKNNFQVYSLDFPGFGQSDEPKTVWSIYDYADMVKSWGLFIRLFLDILLGDELLLFMLGAKMI